MTADSLKAGDSNPESFDTLENSARRCLRPW
jgi:hypothetical protein